MSSSDAGHAFALFENNIQMPGHAYLLEDCLTELSLAPAEDPSSFFRSIQEARDAGHWLTLAADYELGATLEPAVSTLRAGGPAAVARAWIFSSCRMLQGQDLEEWWSARLATLTPQERDAGILHLGAVWSQTRHAAAVDQILAYIQAGDCYQVNLTFPFEGHAYGHPLALFAQLRTSQPVAHGALIHDGQRWILSRSPELFVERRGTRLNCRPMKGTAARHEDPERDQASAAALLASDKERAENLMIVDLIRNDLGRLAPSGGVHVDRLFELESYRSVFQLTSSISAVPVEADLAQIMAALFPCGSITGAPKIRAMQIIDELEDAPRRLYCGALGWLSPDGDFSLSVPIRTLMLNSDQSCRLDVGSGIVADSEPGAEYRECIAKSRFVLEPSAQLQLIETLLWDGIGFPRIQWHLERLQRSASALKFELQPDTAKRRLNELAPQLGAAPARVRLLLYRDGRIGIESFRLDPLPELNSFALADWLLDPKDPRLAHKTTARSFYDAALKDAQVKGLFDLVFCNLRGELAEGARSNLFIERSGRLLTPALQCGVLPGVLRAELISSGQAEEAILHPEDLLSAEKIWLGNALRGLIEVEFRH